MPTIPEIKRITNITFPSYRQNILSNSVPIYIIDNNTLPVIKIDVVFKGGRVTEKKPSSSRIMAGLMNESTLSRSAKEIDEIIDFYGGRMGVSSNMDTITAGLFCLNKHFESLIGLFGEMISEPKFDQAELDTFIKNQKQRLQLSLEENDVIAYREMTANIFGEKHAYGYNSSIENFDDIDPADLKDYFKRNLIKENCFVVVSGMIGAKEFQLIDNVLGSVIQGGEKQGNFYKKKEIIEPSTIFIERPKSVQTAIRIGKATFVKNHPDYTGFYFLNTVLGGYFGARLMQNIRENKGYTYNIFSSLSTMLYDGFFSIGCEASNEYKDPTIKEIFFELEKLQHEKIGNKEMQLVQNYLMGEILKWVDGVYNTADMIKYLVLNNHTVDYFDKFVSDLQTVTPDDIQILAQKYFKKETFHTVVVGK